MSSGIYAGIDLEAPQLVTLAGGQACVFTQRRPGRETPNEDAAAVIPGAGKCCVLAVADGLGGLPAGDMAARAVLQHLAGEVSGLEGDAQREAVLSALEQADASIQATGQGGATTVAVAAIDGDSVRTSMVGDSMVVVCGQRGRIKYCSVPHSPVGYAEASGMLDEAEAMFHTERHLVSNVIGVHGMHVEVGPLMRLAPRDTLRAIPSSSAVTGCSTTCMWEKWSSWCGAGRYPGLRHVCWMPAAGACRMCRVNGRTSPMT